MPANSSLRYGFELERAYIIDAWMQFVIQPSGNKSYTRFMPILTLFTIHPIIQYLLIFENKSMRKDIRALYSASHLALMLNDWIFCFAFSIYPVNPIGAFYCEGPLCKLEINKHILLGILGTPIILITGPFVTLMMRMHQMFVPLDSKAKLSLRAQIILAVSLNVLLVVNVGLLAYFGKDHDDSATLLKEPELAWLSSRGGTIFIFGPPGESQYFKWELRFLGVSILIISPFLVFFTADAMRNIAKSNSSSLSGNTQVMARRMFHIFLFQCLGAVLFYIVPLAAMFSSMIIDATFIPGVLCAPFRAILTGMFTLNCSQFVIFFIVKNPTYRKIVVQKLKQIFLCKFRRRDAKQNFSTIAMNNASVGSRQDKF